MPCGQRMEAAKFLFSLFCFSLFQGLHLPPQSLSYLEPGMAPLWGDLPLGLCSGRSDLERDWKWGLQGPGLIPHKCETLGRGGALASGSSIPSPHP